MVLVWEPITDLPPDWQSLTDGELVPLLQFWNDQRADLEQSGALANFSQRLAREWSIETGQIEGVYDIDRGVTETLIERGIRSDLIPTEPNQKPPELIAAIIQDHYDVLEGLFQFVRGERGLTKGYIHELHASLLRHQETTVVMDQFGKLFEARLLKGRYKERPNNPKRRDGAIHQYCPPEQIDSEMERLLQMHAEHIRTGVPVEIQAAWLHHRFTQIHPYQDGNGRVARVLASLVLIKADWFPMVVNRDDRSRYIESLEVADEGNLRSLVPFLVDVQKRTLFQAIQAAADVRDVHTVEEAIASAKRVLTVPTKSSDPSVWLRAKTTTDLLMEIANRRLSEIVATLTREISQVRPEFKFEQHTNRFDRTPYLTEQQTRYRAAQEIIFESDAGLAWLEIEAEGIGSKFRGLIGIVAIFTPTSGNPQRASKEPFQVNYAESYESAERRFRPWLEASVTNALTLWRKSL